MQRCIATRTGQIGKYCKRCDTKLEPLSEPCQDVVRLLLELGASRRSPSRGCVEAQANCPPGSCFGCFSACEAYASRDAPELQQGSSGGPNPQVLGPLSDAASCLCLLYLADPKPLSPGVAAKDALIPAKAKDQGESGSWEV